ncbi:MAG TPA: hypothetical protein DDZ81_17750 [Acetobacteraceae bacterium]|nr:hypothetical protein [Acetobacteraceae bacterium]
MQPDSTLVGLFRSARLMGIKVGNQTFGFALDGTSRLMVGLSRCVAAALAVERGEPPPVFADAPPPVTPVRSATPAQEYRTAELELEMAATRIATNLLLQAKLPNARLLSGTETPAGLKGRGAVWTSDNGLGAVELLPASTGKDPQQVASNMLSGDASQCKGDFASSRSSDLVDGKIVTKANSLCTDSSGARTIRYFILQADPSGYVVYALTGPNAGNSGASSGSASTTPPMRDADFQTAAVKAAFIPK